MDKYSSNTVKSMLIAIGVFLVAGILYFLPSLQGKTLSQGDVTQFKGSATEIIEFREQGRQIYWTNAMFAGMPNYAISVIDTGNWIRYIPMALKKVLTQPIGLFLLLCIGFYVLMMALNIDMRIAIAASLAFALSTYFIVVLGAGHNAKFHAMAYLPGILAGMIWAYKKDKPLLGAAVLGVFTALELNAHHPQMFYYFSFVILFVGVYEFIKAIQNKKLPVFLKSTGLLLFAAIIAVGTQYAYLKRTLDYSSASTRGQSELSSEATEADEGLDTDYITNWSYGTAETFSWLIPNYKGGASQRIGSDAEALEEIDSRFQQAIAGQSQYFGNQPFVGGPVYLGALIVLFGFFGIFYLKRGFKIPLLIGLILMTMLSWGKNFAGLTDFFIQYVPMYDKFRAVSSIMIVPSLLVPLFGALALNKIIKKPETLEQPSGVGKFSNEKLFYLIAGLLIAFSAISYLAPETFNSFLSEQEQTQLPQQLSQAGFNQSQANQFMDALTTVRESIFKKDAGRTLFLLILGAGLFFLWKRKVLKNQSFAIILGILIIADLWMVDKRYLSEENFVKPSQTQVQKSSADAFILQDSDPNYRVLNLTVSPFNDATTSFFHKSIGGYSGIKLKKYQEVIDYHLQSEVQNLMTRLRNQKFQNPQELFSQTPLLNMLNTKYVIINKQGQPLRNESRNGNAWFVGNIKEVATADEEINALDDVDLKTTAVVRKEFLEKLSSPVETGDGNVELTSYDPELLTYTAKSNSGGLVVFSEIYYHEGWRLMVDDKEVPLVQANYLLRAAQIPAGEHKLEMVFDKDFGTANLISAIACILLLGLIVTKVIVKRKEATNQAG